MSAYLCTATSVTAFQVNVTLLLGSVVPGVGDDASFDSCHGMSPRSGVRKQLLDPIYIGLIYVHLAT